jgi:hypothetical protein
MIQNFRYISGYNVERYGFPSQMVQPKERYEQSRIHYEETGRDKHHPYVTHRAETDEERLWRLTEAELLEGGMTQKEHFQILSQRVKVINYKTPQASL